MSIVGWTGDSKDCFHRYHDRKEKENALEFTWFANSNPSLEFY